MVSVSKSLDLDWTPHFVGPYLSSDLSPNCLPRLSADEIVAGKELGKGIRLEVT